MRKSEETCEGSNTRAGYDSTTEAWYCQDCLMEFHRRQIKPGALVPEHVGQNAGALR